MNKIVIAVLILVFASLACSVSTDPNILNQIAYPITPQVIVTAAVAPSLVRANCGMKVCPVERGAGQTSEQNKK